MEINEGQLEALLEKLVTKKVRQQENRGNGLPDIKIRDSFALWERVELNPPDGEPSRKDYKTLIGNKGLLLDLHFEWEGKQCANPGHDELGPNRGICLGEVLMSEICVDAALAWRLKFEATPKKMQRMGEPTQYYCNGTINRITSGLHGCVVYTLGGKRFKSKSPLRGLGILIEDPDVRADCFFADEEELEDFLQFAHPDLQDMARLSTTSGGMRRGELQRLVIPWVRWDERKIKLPKVWQGKTVTKNGKGREFPLLPREFEMLSRRKEMAEARGTQLLFPNPCDPGHGEIPESTLDGWMRDARRRWGKLLNGVHKPIFHSFRHTWATWCGIKTRDWTIIMRQGGWASPKVAMRYIANADAILAQTRTLLSRSIREVMAEAKAEAEEAARKGKKRETEE